MIQIRPVKLRRWFPPEDPVATAIAMLCILREDLLLELYAITAERLPKIDDNSDGYRRLYFWRNMLRTLEETKVTLNALSASADFRASLAQEPEVQTVFQNARRSLNIASERFLRKLRNEVGGHLDRPAMQAALDDMDHRRQGYIEVGDIKGKLHYRFAGELLLSALLAGIPGDSQEATLERLVRELTEIVRETWQILDDVIACYSSQRRLS